MGLLEFYDIEFRIRDLSNGREHDMRAILDGCIDNIEGFMTKDFSRVVSNQNSNNGTIVFEINEKYGKGKMKMYEILPNLSLSYSHYQTMKPIFNKNKISFHRSALIIHHCINGNMRINLKNKISAFINKGESLFYAGFGDFIDSSIGETGVETITLFCYAENLLQLSEMMGYEKELLIDYMNKIGNRDNLLVSKSDGTTNRIVGELLKYIEENDVPLIRLRGLELYMIAIRNYEMYVSKSEKNYKKDLVDCIIDIKRFIEENWQKNYTIADLSLEFKLSQTYLKEVFKYVYDMGPASYARKYRLEKAKELLESSEMSILEIANLIGYSNPSKFTNAFKLEFGVLPFYYRKDCFSGKKE